MVKNKLLIESLSVKYSKALDKYYEKIERRAVRIGIIYLRSRGAIFFDGSFVLNYNGLLVDDYYPFVKRITDRPEVMIEKWRKQAERFVLRSKYLGDVSKKMDVLTSHPSSLLLLQPKFRIKRPKFISRISSGSSEKIIGYRK